MGQILVTIETKVRRTVEVGVEMVTGQLADTPTRGLSTRGLDNSRTGQVADWTTRGCHRRLSCLVFVLLAA